MVGERVQQHRLFMDMIREKIGREVCKTYDWGRVEKESLGPHWEDQIGRRVGRERKKNWFTEIELFRVLS